MQPIIDFVTANWPALSAILVIILEQILPQTTIVKANSTSQLVVNAVKCLLGRATPLGCLLLLLLAGCSTCNISLNTNAGDNNRPTIRATDNDTPSTTVQTTATVPLK